MESLGEVRPEDGDEEMTEFRDVGGDRTVQGYTPMERLGDDGEDEVEWNTVLNRDDEPDEIHIRDVRDILDEVLRLEEPCSDPRFVGWLIRHKEFEVDRTGDHKFSYYGKDVDGDITWNRYRAFIVGGISNEDWSLARREIREYYDDWVNYENKRVMGRARLITGIGIGIVALVTGLSLGLKRAGNDLQHGGPRPWTKIGPARTPWTEIEDTARKVSGGILVWIGDHLVLVIGGVVLHV